MAVSRHPSATMFMHVDERATAFMALGYGRATGKAAGWITTSGTALANGYPAVIEASMEAVPMLLLTADRPPELRDTDANQTIRQDHLFGTYVRWFVDLPTPSEEISATWLLSTIDEAVHRSTNGPVHLNCMYRKPLVPAADDVPTRSAWWESERSRSEGGGWTRWLATGQPFTKHIAAQTQSDAIVADLAARIQFAERPVFVFGRLRGNTIELKEAAAQLIDGCATVGLVDIGSQLRTGLTDQSLIPAVDAVLYGAGRDVLTPDLIVQFGATPVSMRQVTWAPDSERIVVDGRPRRIDPASRGGTRVHADPLALMKLLSARVKPADSRVDPSWKKRWLAIREAIVAWMASDLGDSLSEQHVARLFSQNATGQISVTVASSNPARHADLFFAMDGPLLPVSLNRGASGIDGTLATACGFADGSATRPCILIGDLALQHDLTSLALCAQRGAVVVVVNNDGGGIFSYLPIREHTDVFEPWFGTPHGQGFERAAAHFGLDYAQPRSVEELESQLGKAFFEGKGYVIEITTDRQDNLDEQRRLLRALGDRIDAIIEDGGSA